jgi:hypothetical protein
MVFFLMPKRERKFTWNEKRHIQICKRLNWENVLVPS